MLEGFKIWGHRIKAIILDLHSDDLGSIPSGSTKNMVFDSECMTLMSWVYPVQSVLGSSKESGKASQNYQSYSFNLFSKAINFHIVRI